MTSDLSHLSRSIRNSYENRSVWCPLNVHQHISMLLWGIGCLFTFTFTFMHLADAFIQSDLQLHSGYTFSLVHVFPGNRTHNLLHNRRNALPLSHTGTLYVLFTYKNNVEGVKIWKVEPQSPDKLYNWPWLLISAANHRQQLSTELTAVYLKTAITIQLHLDIKCTIIIFHKGQIGQISQDAKRLSECLKLNHYRLLKSTLHFKQISYFVIIFFNILNSINNIKKWT